MRGRGVGGFDQEEEARRRERFRTTRVPRFVSHGDSARRDLIVRGLANRGLRDTYHHLLTMRWWQFALLSVAIYVGLNTFFGFLYWLDPKGLAGARPGSFVDAFNFSVETLGTIGYGAISPRGPYANTLVAIEAFLNIAVTALATGMIFSRVARPTARVLFAERALITTFEGRRVFMFRAANQRNNQVLEAEVTISLARSTTTVEGLAFRRLEDLRPTRQRSPLFALSWQVVHVIDETSPLFGLNVSDLKASQGEIIIVLAGTDPTFASRIHARHSYLPGEIVWDAYYEDVVYPETDGRWVIDYTRFHNTRPATPASPEPR